MWGGNWHYKNFFHSLTFIDTFLSQLQIDLESKEKHTISLEHLGCQETRIPRGDICNSMKFRCQ